MSLSEVIAAAVASGATTLATGTVDVELRVTVQGVPVPATWLDGVVVDPGSTVLLALARAETGQSSAVVLGRIGAGPRVSAATVLSVAGQICTVRAGTRTLDCTFVGAAPAVGARVRVLYQGPVPTVLGVAGEVVPPPPPPPVIPPDQGESRTGTTAFPATQTGSYLASGYLNADKGVVQGTGFGSSSNIGMWWYGAGPSSLAGRTVLGGRLLLTGRVDAGAPNAALTVSLGLHDQAAPAGRPARLPGFTQSVSVPARSGAWPVTVDLPVSWVQRIIAGAGLLIDGPAYGGVHGLNHSPLSGQLSIDWRT